MVLGYDSETNEHTLKEREKRVIGGGFGPVLVSVLGGGAARKKEEIYLTCFATRLNSKMVVVKNNYRWSLLV